MDTSKLTVSLKAPLALEILPSACASNYFQLEVEKRRTSPIAHPQTVCWQWLQPLRMAVVDFRAQEEG